MVLFGIVIGVLGVYDVLWLLDSSQFCECFYCQTYVMLNILFCMSLFVTVSLGGGREMWGGSGSVCVGILGGVWGGGGGGGCPF